MNESTLKQADLYNFTGTEHYYKHPLFPRYKFTDGVAYLVESGMCLWLLTMILSLSPTVEKKVKGFAQWKFKVNPDKTGILTCENGNEKIVLREEINYTDFPLQEITLWMEGDVLILPSEH